MAEALGVDVTELLPNDLIALIFASPTNPLAARQSMADDFLRTLYEGVVTSLKDNLQTKDALISQLEKRNKWLEDQLGNRVAKEKPLLPN